LLIDKKGRIMTKSYGEPHNYYFWLSIIGEPKTLQEFLERGNRNQKKSIIKVLNYIKIRNKELFLDINGKYWLREFKRKKVNNV
jgi:hypothetical protein